MPSMAHDHQSVPAAGAERTEWSPAMMAGDHSVRSAPERKHRAELRRDHFCPSRHAASNAVALDRLPHPERRLRRTRQRSSQ
ncbi:hypothetical protein EJB05_10486, partial [Eragrostis curvula]